MLPRALSGLPSSPGPPSPTDVKVLHDLGDIPNVIVSSILLGHPIDRSPLVDENGDGMLVPQRDGILVEVHQVPVIVEGHLVVDSIVMGLSWAASVSPALVEVTTVVDLSILLDGMLIIVIE